MSAHNCSQYSTCKFVFKWIPNLLLQKTKQCNNDRHLIQQTIAKSEQCLLRQKRPLIKLLSKEKKLFSKEKQQGNSKFEFKRRLHI